MMVDPEPVSVQQIGTWIFIAFVPSSLMLAITTKISSDLGALPMIWVIPLALYILSFVVAFSNRQLVNNAGLTDCRDFFAGSMCNPHEPQCDRATRPN